MPTPSIHFDSLMSRIQTANANDTLVMKDSGEISSRGRLRTHFTNVDRYRETTRQFIQEFCSRYGEGYRDYAESFF